MAFWRSLAFSEVLLCLVHGALCFYLPGVAFSNFFKLLKTFPNATKYLKTLVSFGKVTPEQKQQVEKSGVTIYSWDEFLEGHNQSFDLPIKKKSEICTIMYTSGTTGDPKGVMTSNESIITFLAAIKQVLGSCNEQLHEKDVYLSYLALAHIFDTIVEEAIIWAGASVGFWRGVKQALGGNARIILPGAAPLSKHVEGFLRVVTCAHILQGYGCSWWLALYCIDRRRKGALSVYVESVRFRF